MVPLTEWRRVRLVLAAAGFLVAPCVATFAQTGSVEDADAAASAMTQDGLDEAESSYLAADFERARDLALAETSRLEELPPEARPRERLARAYSILVQALYNLGQADLVDETIDRLIALAPGYALDPATAGARLVERVDQRRRALVGRIRITCQPLPCEDVLIDGRPVALDSEGLFPALAGSRTVTVRRHNFEDHLVEAVEVVASQSVEVLVELVQRARDLRIATEPGGADVYLDGELVGVTASGETGEPARLELREIAPGGHVLELRLPCYRRLEQRVEVILDRLDPSPVDLGVVELTRARGVAEIVWDRAEGVVSLDGAAVPPGRHELCPGSHEASVSLGGRRVWFESFEMMDGTTVSLEPRPRPTIAVIELGDAPDARAVSFAGADWNRVRLGKGAQADAARELERELADAWATTQIPAHPGRALADAKELAAAAGRLAPEADLVAAWVEMDSALRPVRALLLVSPRTGLMEASAWPSGSDEADGDAARLLARSESLAAPFAGFDVADRLTGPPVVASVHPRGPAAEAGLAPGMVVLSVEGADDEGAAKLHERIQSMTVPGTLAVEVLAGSQRKTVPVAVVPNLTVSTPASWRDRFLLPPLAHAEVDRIAGTGSRRLHGSLTIGMILASLGRTEPAALALDRASIDETMDPSGDARGTVLFVLERLFRELGNVEYATEIAARRSGLKDVRFGGRGGAPLRHARSSVED